MNLIGVDVGGSAIKLGSIDEDGRILAEETSPLPDPLEAPLLFEIIADRVHRMSGGDLPRGIGVGLPAMLDPAREVVQLSPNLPWLNGVRVRSGLAEKLDVPPELVRIENDANVAALGEQWQGAAKGRPRVLVLTLGTGIGSGLILDDRLFVGEGFASESGHIVVDPSGPPCGCGARGCVETLASASAVRRRAIERALPAEDPGNLERLAARAREGSGGERDLLHEVGLDLGHALAMIVTVLDLRTFVFGGGFSAALDTMEEGIRQGIAEWARPDRVSGISIVRAALGPAAGWIGAARLTLP